MVPFTPAGSGARPKTAERRSAWIKAAVTELRLQTELGVTDRSAPFSCRRGLKHAHLLEVEIAQALRRLVRAGHLAADRAQEALDDFAHFDVRRHAHTDFLGRAWEVRDTLTAYDAMYVAHAEALDARVGDLRRHLPRRRTTLCGLK
jgi:predicted nucleic acid-binding protein